MERDLAIKLDRIEQSLLRLNNKLTLFIQEKKKRSWVRSSVITEITGWNKYQMQNARENAYVIYKKDENGFFYDVDSIHPVFLKGNKS